MAKRFSRKKVKQNEFVSTLERMYEFSQQAIKKYSQIIFWSITAVIVFGIVSFSWNYYRNSKEEKAYVLLYRALKRFEAPVLNSQENKPLKITGPFFKNAEEKYQSSIKYFQEVLDEYPSTPSSATASYYQGLCYANLNRFDEAIVKFQQSLKAPLPKLTSPLARYALARSYETKGNFQQALKIYEKIFKKDSDFIPQDESLMKLGLCYEKLNQLDKAIAQYRKIVNDFPDSLNKTEAQDKLDAIAPPASTPGPEEK